MVQLFFALDLLGREEVEIRITTGYIHTTLFSNFSHQGIIERQMNIMRNYLDQKIICRNKKIKISYGLNKILFNYVKQALILRVVIFYAFPTLKHIEMTSKLQGLLCTYLIHDQNVICREILTCSLL